MRQERITATHNVTRQLKNAERAIDQAGIELAGLCVTILKERQAAGLSAIVGADAFANVAQTFARWAEVREKIVHNHQMLDQVSDQIGTKITGGGLLDDKPGIQQVLEQKVVRIAA
jgi:multidrug resistance efflux pump